MNYILASKSPRRRELLAQMGLEFEVIVADCDEDISAPSPSEMVRELALRKARAVRDRLIAEGRDLSDTAIIGSDTVVVLDGAILGKPRDPDDALATLLRLSGRVHSVFTGIAVLDRGSERSDAVETRVSFAEITRAEAEAYVASGEPLDKAGSYGIQGRGAIFVKAIDGDYFSVVGLPIRRLYELLHC